MPYIDIPYVETEARTGFTWGNGVSRISDKNLKLKFKLPDNSILKNKIVDYQLLIKKSNESVQANIRAFYESGDIYFEVSQADIRSYDEVLEIENSVGLIETVYTVENSSKNFLTSSTPTISSPVILYNSSDRPKGTYNDKPIESNSFKSSDVYIIFTLREPTQEHYWNFLDWTQWGVVLRLFYEEISGTVTPVFPVNSNVKRSKPNTFTWKLNNAEGRTNYIQQSAVVKITQNGVTKQYNSTSNNYVVVPANELELGSAKYVVEVTTNYGTTVVSQETSFTVVGETGAPTITSVTQNSYPTISWESNNQAAWQMIVKSSDGVVYQSGMINGDSTSYQLPVMLEDGPYSVEMRILNEFGYYSGWSSYGFDLSPDKPDAPTSIFTSVTDDYGVAIDCENPETYGTLFVIRRKHESNSVEVIGEYYKGFVDYSIPINSPYEYTVRNYVTGCADGEWMDAVVKAPGMVLRSGDNKAKHIHLWKVEDGEFNIISSDTRQYSLMNCLGRKYPVKERGEWYSSIREVDLFIPQEEFDDLIELSTKATFVYLQSSNEFIPCAISVDDRGTHMNEGRFVTITLTRIDGE